MKRRFFLAKNKNTLKARNNTENCNVAVIFSWGYLKYMIVLFEPVVNYKYLTGVLCHGT